MATQQVTWTGRSGRKYTMSVYDKYGSWNNVPGIYIFAGINAKGLWEAFYVGETESFGARIPNHEVWPAAVRQGATHVHAAVLQGGKAARHLAESDLIQAYRPSLNDKLSVATP